MNIFTFWISEYGLQDFDMVKSYVSKIQELEGKLLYLQSSNNCNRNSFVDCLDLEDDSVHSKDTFLPGLHDGQSDCDGKWFEISSKFLKASYLYINSFLFQIVNLFSFEDI